MDEDAYNALMMAFAVIVFVMALSITMYMLNKLTYTSELLAFYNDKTNYYDNIEFGEGFEGIEEGTTAREVKLDTVSATIYRYYKENFCVKIYDATNASEKNKLLQVFDVNLEGMVHAAISDSRATLDYLGHNMDPNETLEQRLKHVKNYSLRKAYDDSSKPYYMWGAPWLGNTGNLDEKLRIDLYLAGKSGFINGYLVNYENNDFYNKMIRDTAADDKYKIIERFVSYSYTGTTFETDEGDILVTGGQAAKDKILIIYTIENK